MAHGKVLLVSATLETALSHRTAGVDATDRTEGFVEPWESTLQREQEIVREMYVFPQVLNRFQAEPSIRIYEDSPYGRSNSYRGFGAGGLQPRRHTNPKSYITRLTADLKGANKTPMRPILLQG